MLELMFLEACCLRLDFQRCSLREAWTRRVPRMVMFRLARPQP